MSEIAHTDQIIDIDEDFPYEGRSLPCLDTSDIIMLHDHQHTTQLFYDIVERYRAKGIQFRSVA